MQESLKVRKLSGLFKLSWFKSTYFVKRCWYCSNFWNIFDTYRHLSPCTPRAATITSVRTHHHRSERAPPQARACNSTSLTIAHSQELKNLNKKLWSIRRRPYGPPRWRATKKFKQGMSSWADFYNTLGSSIRWFRVNWVASLSHQPKSIKNSPWAWLWILFLTLLW